MYVMGTEYEHEYKQEGDRRQCALCIGFTMRALSAPPYDYEADVDVGD